MSARPSVQGEKAQCISAAHEHFESVLLIFNMAAMTTHVVFQGFLPAGLPV